MEEKSMKFKEWLNEWLEVYVKPTNKIQTYNKYRAVVKNHISKSLGEKDMEELSAEILQQFIAKLVQQNLSTNTINGIFSILKISLKTAKNNEKVEKIHINSLILPKTHEKQVKCFSKTDQQKIEKYILESPKSKLFGIVLCLYSGLRIGELLALKWKDVDFAKECFYINKTCYDSWQNGKYLKVVDLPKTENSIRTIPIFKKFLPKLKEIRKKSKSNYVVEGKFNQGISIRSYQYTFERLLKKLNIEHKGFHSLRHTFATRALEVGMDIKTLSEILGHSNPMITLKRYAHSLLEHKSEMINRLSKISAF